MNKLKCENEVTEALEQVAKRTCGFSVWRCSKPGWMMLALVDPAVSRQLDYMISRDPFLPQLFFEYPEMVCGFLLLFF